MADSIRIRVRMTARPIDEPNRVSSQLELLFDLVFVVAIPVAVFLVLLWAVHTTIASVPAIHPGAVLGCTALVLLLPLATTRTGTVAVIAALTLCCVLLAAVTTAGQRPRD